MYAKADHPARRLFRLAAAACLLLMTIGLADRSFASGYDAGVHAEAASRAAGDAGHSESGCWHPDHSDESDIPVVDVPVGLGPARRLPSSCSDGRTAVSLRPPVRPPSP
jgi:hypothetical protein